MNAMISFCFGIVCIAVSNDIGGLTHIGWLSVICDILGGCLLIFGSKLYLDNKKTELQNKEEILIILNNLSKNILTTNDMQNINDRLDKISDVRKEMLGGLSTRFEIIEGYFSYVKENIEKADSMNKVQVIKLLECIEKLNNDTDESLKKIETLLVEHNEIENELHNAISNVTNTMENISEKEIKHIDNLDNDVKKIPTEILEILENCVSRMNNQCEAVMSRFEYLSDDLEEMEKKINNTFIKIMEEIQDYNTDCNENMTEEIKKLSGQYEQFMKISKEMIQQMTLMSESDFEIMKDLLNG